MVDIGFCEPRQKEFADERCCCGERVYGRERASEVYGRREVEERRRTGDELEDTCCPPLSCVCGVKRADERRVICLI